MRWIWVVVVVACKKETGTAQQPPPAPAPVRATGDAAAADGGGAGLVELLHGAPSTVRVSSRVANKAILPAHLVDGDLNTAWNSRTGELAGAWIDVEVPGAQIRELRLTVGHTGKSPKGDDYFVMNPRIKKVSLVDGSTVLASATLDPNVRALQVVALPAPAAHVRLRVDEIVPGTKKMWRETCVSELEAWGTPPAGVTAKRYTPSVEVGDPPDDSWMTPPIKDVGAYCDRLMKDANAEYERMAKEQNAACKDQPPSDEPGPCNNPDPPGEPRCEITTDAKVTDAYWHGAGIMWSANDSVYGARPTQLVLSTKDGDWPIGEEIDTSSFADGGRKGLHADAAKVRKTGELDVTYTFRHDGDDHVFTMTCKPGSPPTCSDPVETKP